MTARATTGRVKIVPATIVPQRIGRNMIGPPPSEPPAIGRVANACKANM
jgi:hypothetical protein